MESEVKKENQVDTHQVHLY